MTLNQLRYFQTLARTEHYHKAAELLFISQPSLSKAIAQLEDELGVALFDKKGRNVVLSDAGKRFLPYVMQAIDKLEQGIDTLQTFQAETETLSIGCISPALIPFLSPLLKEYQEAAQAPLRYRTHIAISEKILEELTNDLYDVVFCSYVKGLKNIAFTLVYEAPYYVVVSKDSAFAARESISPKELHGCPMLFTESSAYSQMIHEILDYHQASPIVAGVSNEESGLLSMVEAGLGVFISMDHPQIHGPNTVLVPLAQGEFKRGIYMATSKSRKHSLLVKEWISFVQNYAARQVTETFRLIPSTGCPLFPDTNRGE